MSVWRTKTRLLVYVNVIHLVAHVLIYIIYSYNLYDIYTLILIVQTSQKLDKFCIVSLFISHIKIIIMSPKVLNIMLK